MLDPFGGLEAVHPRHLPIHDHDIVWSISDGFFHLLQAFFAGSGQSDFETERFEHLLENFPGCRIVVHNQCFDPSEVCRRKVASSVFFQVDTENSGKKERAADSGSTFHPDMAPHHFHQSVTDGQPQPGAAVLAGNRRVCLGERGEQLQHLFVGHTNAGIAYPEFDFCTICLLLDQFRENHDFTVIGELEGIVGQVDQNLAQPQGIPNK